jgi:beta-glucanase (GH16 family)
MWLRIIVCAGLLVLLCTSASALPSGIGSMTWSDEFDGTELDLTKWFYRATGPRQDGYLTPEAVSVADGALKIKTYTEGGVNYSGMIGNYLFNPAFGVGAVNGMNQTYGYFEVRAKFHTTSGTSSAFWLQSATIGMPIGNPQAAGVEMDIFEHRARIGSSTEANLYPGVTTSTDVTNRVNNALIWDGYGSQQQLRRQLSNTLPGLGNDSWHTYGLRWTPTNDSLADYTFYFDGVAIWSGGGAPVSQAPEYIILSTEVFASFAGPIPVGGYGARGDFNGDSIVDTADYVVWRQTSGQTVGKGSGADANTDGFIGPEDYAVWRANFGRTASVTNVQFDYVRAYALAGSGGGAGVVGSGAVPEPNGLLLIGCGIAALVARRKRRVEN